MTSILVIKEKLSNINHLTKSLSLLTYATTLFNPSIGNFLTATVKAIEGISGLIKDIEKSNLSYSDKLQIIYISHCHISYLEAIRDETKKISLRARNTHYYLPSIEQARIVWNIDVMTNPLEASKDLYDIYDRHLHLLLEDNRVRDPNQVIVKTREVAENNLKLCIKKGIHDNGWINRVIEGEKLDLILREITNISKHLNENLPKEKTEVLDHTLTSFEKDYLTGRINHWKQGYINRQQTYSSLEIYKSNLYIPLDGSSTEWIEKENKIIRMSPADYNFEENITRTALRKSLLTWIDHQDTNWLVLVGEPGGGKTIFLTNLALNLATRILTEDQHESKSKQKESEKKIPIILEARKLLMHDGNDIKILIKEIANEISYFDNETEQKIIKERLFSGRYFLLIDAIDEISDIKKRTYVLNTLKGLQKILIDTNAIITSRSVNYTGVIEYTPDFDVIHLERFSIGQTLDFCKEYCNIHKKDAEFSQALQNEVRYMTEGSLETLDHIMIGNPFMLTAFCNFYERHQKRPKSKLVLFETIVDDLLTTKIEDFKKNSLTKKEKEKYLSSIAWEMIIDCQIEWSKDSIEDLISEISGVNLCLSQQHTRLLIEQTGLLFLDDEGEKVRFNHRLIRDYLAAIYIKSNYLSGNEITNVLLSTNIDSENKVNIRWIDRDWQDCVFFLYSMIRNPEISKYLIQNLWYSSRDNPSISGRAHSVTLGMIAESSLNFDQIWIRKLVHETVNSYEQKSFNWAVHDSFEFLENLGKVGDFRCNPIDESYWIKINIQPFLFGKENHKLSSSNDFWFGKYNVTCSEFSKFAESNGYLNESYWDLGGLDWKEKNKINGPKRIEQAFKWSKPNRPVLCVCFWEAKAYCRWLTEKIKKEKPSWWISGMMIDLPTEAQWERAARGTTGRLFPWNGALNNTKANYGGKHGYNQTTPVGCYPNGATPNGILDMVGNVWEWCLDYRSDKYHQFPKNYLDNKKPRDPFSKCTATQPQKGGGWESDEQKLICFYSENISPSSRSESIGFRCCLNIIKESGI